MSSLKKIHNEKIVDAKEVMITHTGVDWNTDKVNVEGAVPVVIADGLEDDEDEEFDD